MVVKFHFYLVIARLLLSICGISAQLSDSFSIQSFTGPITATASVNCASILTSCQFAQPECVEAWCEGACNDGSSCCQQSNPQLCLVEANLQDPCVNIENSVVICPFNVPDCVCYDNLGNYAPEPFDNMALQCSSLAVTQYPELIENLTGTKGAIGFCTREAGPRNTTATTTAADAESKAVASSSSTLSVATVTTSQSLASSTNFATSTFSSITGISGSTKSLTPTKNSPQPGSKPIAGRNNIVIAVLFILISYW